MIQPRKMALVLCFGVRYVSDIALAFAKRGLCSASSPASVRMRFSFLLKIQNHMPQKYKISMRGACSDRLLTNYFFSPKVIHDDWGGTLDGRFYSKAAAIDCLFQVYNHYLDRFEAGLADCQPMWTGSAMFYRAAFFYIEKA